jgi:hypothetical protein
MSTAIRILIGIGLFSFGFHLGRAVGRLDPLAEELRAMRRRRGVVIEGEKAESEPQEKQP